MSRDQKRALGYSGGRRESFRGANLLLIGTLAAWFIFFVLPMLLDIALGAGVASRSIALGLVTLVAIGGVWSFFHFGHKEPVLRMIRPLVKVTMKTR